MSLAEVITLINDSELGTALRESIYMYPIVEGIHLVGLAFSVGLILFVDLRLIGIFLRQLPVNQVLKPLRPWLLAGFTVTFLSGLLLFIADAEKVTKIWLFPVKLALIVLAGLNAAWFEYRWGKRLQTEVASAALPAAVRLAGLASLLLWSTVVAAGRMIPYLAYK